MYPANPDQAGQVVMACLGDSITYGYPFGTGYSWVEKAGRQFPGLHMINRGVNGDTTLDMLRRFRADVLETPATHVHIMGGINDAWLNLEPSQSQTAIQKMVELSLDNSISPILGLTTPICTNPAGGETFFPFGIEEIMHWLARFRRWLREFAKAYSIPLIDYCTTLSIADTDCGIPEYFYDQCHLSRTGYELMARTADSFIYTFLR